MNQKHWGKHFSDEEIAAARSGGRLLTMEIETSHECNLRCIYCYNSSGRKQHNELSLDEILNAVEQGIDLGVRRIIIIGGGEPMLHPQLLAIIKHARRRALGIDLFTNGTLITAEWAQTLYEHGVEPVVKLNSLRAAVQDMLATRPGTFDSIQRGLENLLRAGYPDPDHALGIESIVCRANLAEMPEMWRWARDRGIVPYFEMITFQGRARERQDLNVSVEALERLFKTLAAIDREHYGLDWEPHPPIAALSCSRHEYSCTLTASGAIQPCTGVDIKIGDIRHAPLGEILSQSVVARCLRNVREEIKGACRECELRPSCYGCRGMAYHFTGDFLAADPLCWRNPRHIRIEEQMRNAE